MSEAVLYGLPWSSAQDAAALVAGATPEDDMVLAVPAALYRAVAVLADPTGDTRMLREGAAALRSERVGYRRAALRVAAHLLEAEAERRAGDARAAARAADSGIGAAAALGHVWLEARLRRLRLGLPGGESQQDRLHDLVRRASEGVAPDERPFLIRAWSAET
jgi:hypothetical protein